MAYATVDDLRQRMGHDELRRAETVTSIDAMLDSASSTIEDDCGRVFASSSGARTFYSPRHWRELVLPPKNEFTAVTSVKVDDDDDGSFETTITDYELDGPRVSGWPYDTIRLLDRSWPSGGNRQLRIEITATWGWSAVPVAIKEATCLLVARHLARATSAPLGVQSFAGGDGAAYMKSTDPDYLHMIRPYRLAPQVA